ncbi:YkvA family protein [Rhizobium halophytocola]|uniref:Uncharacterized membrane protein YkvA (DUF1232 family) n=1 Tax=Rhizobium halophytocola TaxID=735519 RepID=A0ABS4DXD4_9HYPH|nr:YkvA family protein [Rhizobium halophytocola]MBP1850332.1 uncharacterized membrane protein YkvA (DUF1232 family) [Rhizobium halophytocola]
MVSGIRQWAGIIKRDTLSLYLAARDPRTPWPAKLIAASVVAYALSPIDLIPDFIPVIGYLDDVVLVPIGLWIAVRLVPREVMADCRARAAQLSERPTSRIAAAVFVLIWLGAATATGWLAYQALAG